MENERDKNSQEQRKADYVRIRLGEVVSSEEVRPGVVLDFDANGRVIAIETYSGDVAGSGSRAIARRRNAGMRCRT